MPKNYVQNIMKKDLVRFKEQIYNSLYSTAKKELVPFEDKVKKQYFNFKNESFLLDLELIAKKKQDDEIELNGDMILMDAMSAKALLKYYKDGNRLPKNKVELLKDLDEAI